MFANWDTFLYRDEFGPLYGKFHYTFIGVT